MRQAKHRTIDSADGTAASPSQATYKTIRRDDLRRRLFRRDDLRRRLFRRGNAWRKLLRRFSATGQTAPLSVSPPAGDTDEDIDTDTDIDTDMDTDMDIDV